MYVLVNFGGRPQDREPQKFGVASWGDKLSESVDERHVATGPVGVEGGKLVVPFSPDDAPALSQQPVSAISGAVLVGTSGSAETIDLFTFIQPDPKIRASRPTYVGTFSREQSVVTEQTLRDHGISVNRLASAKL